MIKYCSNCGNEIKDGADICLNCGKIINAKNNEYNQRNDGYVQQNSNAKSKIAAGILGILLGSFGVHNFYLGYTGKAVGQLLITLLSCFVLSPISALWGFIEGILILCGSINTDASGRKLID